MTDSAIPRNNTPEQIGRHETRPGAWSELFSPAHLAVALVMPGGVLLYAMNLYFTAALMPTIVNNIGGAQYYAWVTTAFVTAAIIGSLFVGRVLGHYGARTAYVIAFVLFGGGATLNALSPSMSVLIAARFAQGLGGGFLVGLGYAVIRTVLPQRLWGHGASLTASMWGVGALIGPAAGGTFAEFGAWRLAYGAIATAAALLIVIASRAFTNHSNAPTHRAAIPVASLITLILAATAISLAALVPVGWQTAATMGVGAVLLVIFVWVERRSTAPILPTTAYRSDNTLKWVLLTAALLSVAVMAENFIPLFGQQLGYLNPLWAGLLGAVLSLGWVLAQLLVVSVKSETVRRRAIRTGPIVLTLSLLVFGLLLKNNPGQQIVAWFVALFVGGIGIGIAYPLLTVAAMTSSADPSEGRKAAAAIATTQIMTFAIASALAGGFMTLGAGSPLNAAHFVILGFACITSIGIATAARATPSTTR